MLHKLNHSVFLVLAFIYIVAILFSNSIMLDFMLLGLTLLNLVCMVKLKIRYIIYFILLLIPGQCSIFIMTLIFSNHHSTNYIDWIWQFFHLKIAYPVLKDAIFLSSRVFCLSLISFMWVIHIDFEQAILYLMQIKWLNITIGYSLFAMVNAFKFMQKEFKRILIAYRMRKLKFEFLLRIIYPLMVSATRYAHCVSLSMESRGLNKDKTFIVSVKGFGVNELGVLLFNLLIIIILLKII